MGSKKKRAEKKKDFVKPKLRVGKSKPKPTSHTDTSFVAKSLSIPSQSITRSLSSDASFQHYLDLTKHNSSTTRKEALLYIESHVADHITNLRPIITSISPLILDMSQSVRSTLLELFKTISLTISSPKDLESHTSFIMLYIHSAMTHITPEIRAQSTLFLDVLMDVTPNQLVRSSWTKTIACFFALFGWPTPKVKEPSLNIVPSSWSAQTISSSLGSSFNKSKVTHLKSLLRLLRAGLEQQITVSSSLTPSIALGYHHPSCKLFLLHETVSPFMTLNLFASSATTKNSITEDLESRQQMILQYIPIMTTSLQEIIKEGGEAGRVAKTIITYSNQLVSK